MRTHPLSAFTGAGRSLASRSRHLVALCGAVAAGLAAVVFGFPVIPAAWAATSVTAVTVTPSVTSTAGASGATYAVAMDLTTGVVGGTDLVTIDGSANPNTTSIVFPSVASDYKVSCASSGTTCNGAASWGPTTISAGPFLGNSVAGACSASGSGTNVVTVQVPTSASVSGGITTTITVTITASVKNPTVASTTDTLNACTTADVTPATSSNFTIVAGTASKLALSCVPVPCAAAASASPNLELAVVAEDAYNNPSGTFPAGDGGSITVNLSSNSTGVTKEFNTGAGCAAPTLTSVTITSATPVDFCYGDEKASSPTWMITGTDPATGGVGSASVTVTINAGVATKLAFSCPAGCTGTASNSPNLEMAVVAEDANSNPTCIFPAGDSGNGTTCAAGSVTVNLSSGSAGTKEFSTFSSGACTTTIVTSVTIAVGVSTPVDFCYGDTALGSPTITGADSTATLTSATQAVTINAGSGAQLVVTCGAPCTATASAQCASAYSDGCPGTIEPTLGPFTVKYEDSSGNPATCSSCTVNLVSSSTCLTPQNQPCYMFSVAPSSSNCNSTVTVTTLALNQTIGGIANAGGYFCYADELSQAASTRMFTPTFGGAAVPSCPGGSPAPNGLVLCATSTSVCGGACVSVGQPLTINPEPVGMCTSGSSQNNCGGAVAFLNGGCPGSGVSPLASAYQAPLVTGQVSGSASFFADIPVCMQLTDQFGNSNGQSPVAPTGGVNESVFSYPTAPGAVVATSKFGANTSSVAIPAGSTNVTFYVGDSNSGFDTFGAWGDVTQLGTSKGGVACGSVCGIGFGPGGLDVTISPGTAVSNPTITPNPNTQSGTATYTVSFQTSSSGTSGIGCGSYNLCGSTLATQTGDVIELDASVGAAGTYFPTNPADYTVGVTGGAAPAQVALTPTMSHCASTNPAPTDCTTVIFTVPVNAAAGAQVNVTIKDVTNPSSESTQDYMNVATSTDSQSVQSVYYSIANGTGQNMTIIGSPAQSTDLGTPFGSPFEVKLTDASGNPIVNTSVTFCDGTYSPTTTTCTPASGAGGTFQSSGSYVETDQTNASGIAQASQFSANQVNGSYSVSANAFGFAPATFSLTNGASVGVSTEKSAAVANPSRVPADGISTSIITVTLVNGSGVPLEGKTVTLASSSTFAKIVPLLPVTNAQGQATFSVSDTHDEPVTFTATDTTDSEVVNELAEVTFGNAAVLTVSPTCGTTGTGVTNYCVVFQAPQPVGTTSAPESITFTNSGSAILTVTGVTVGGYDQNDFQPAPGGTCGLQLTKGQSCTFNLQFTPQGTCTRQANLQISYNGLGSPVTIDAIGTGANADGSVPPDCASIPTVSSGGSGVGTQARGYWMDSADGGVYTFGGAGYFGSAGQLDPSAAPGGNNAVHLAAPIVGMASTPDGKGYWLVASDGGVFAFGDAGFFGSAGGLHLAAPIVGMASTPDGKGYWLVASDGGIFTYGDAGYFGSAGQLNPGATPGGTNSVHLAAPIVGMESTPDGAGYWLVASDGGVFAFGNAGFFGSVGIAGTRVVSMSTTSDGKGYWLLDAAGSVHPFGDAAFLGATGSPSSVLATVPGGSGSSGTGSQDYLIAGPTGAVVTFGAASYQGDAVGTPLAAPIVGLAPVE